MILVLNSGSAIGLEEELPCVDAILQAWYPGQAGGTAVADVLFGDYNPAGRLPVTFYKSTAQLPDFEDYNMTGRTYRYMTEEPLFPFGHGLSYTTFDYGKASISKKIKAGKASDITITLTNTGSRDGDEVIQVYVRNLQDPQGPKNRCVPSNVFISKPAKTESTHRPATHDIRLLRPGHRLGMVQTGKI